MRTAFVENLMDGLAFMVEKREEHAVLAWALFLDPRSGKGSMQYWQDVVNCQGKGTGMNEIVKFYWGLMIKVLVRLHQHRNPAWGHNQAPSPEQGGFLTSLTRPSGQGRRNNEKALHQSMEAQMQRFLLQPFTCSSSLPGPTRTKLAMQWLSEQRHLYPDVVALAQSVLVIPGTQMDNERLFSLAGILSKGRRNRMSTENMDSILQVYYNHPDDPLDDLDLTVEEVIELESQLQEVARMDGETFGEISYDSDSDEVL
eukprot:GHVU01048518.1.p1 GENE.GHVU01048518.1~~GHVU01048518.1.p1  ORF type:complete len:257 (+),score=31.29 GHVU01048518.1:329-1099(+)